MLSEMAAAVTQERKQYHHGDRVWPRVQTCLDKTEGSSHCCDLGFVLLLCRQQLQLFTGSLEICLTPNHLTDL